MKKLIKLGCFMVTLGVFSNILAQDSGKGDAKPYLGVTTTMIRDLFKDHMDLPDGAGVMVEYVYPKSAAEEGGVKRGDVLVSVNQEMIDSPLKLKKEIANYEVGDLLELELRRKGAPVYLPVTLKERAGLGMDYSAQFNKLREKNDVLKNFLKKLESKQMKIDMGAFSSNWMGAGEDFDVSSWTKTFDFGKTFGGNIEVIDVDPSWIQTSIQVLKSGNGIDMLSDGVDTKVQIMTLDEDGNWAYQSGNQLQQGEMSEILKKHVEKVTKKFQEKFKNK